MQLAPLALRAPEGPRGSDGLIGPSGANRPSAHELGVAAAQALGPAVARGLGFDLHAAVRAHQVRLVVLHTVDGQPLPADWAIPIVVGEVVVACATLKPPLSGVAALIVRCSLLPRPKLDEAARDRIAHALADALLADLMQRSP
jgi:hypothetical protein